jgi:hypothetical protein
VQGKKIWGSPSNTDNSSFDPITTTTNQLLGNVSFPTYFRTTVNVGARVSKTEGQSIDRVYSAGTSTTLYSNRDTYLKLDLSASYSVSQETLVMATLQLFFSSGKFTNSVTAGFRKDNNFDGADNTGSVGGATVEWRDFDAANFGTKLKGAVNTDAGRETYDANVENFNNASTLEVDTRYSQGAGQAATTQYNSSIDTRMVWTGNTFSFGGSRFDNNGVIVRIDEARDTKQQTPGTFQVLKDSQVVKVISTNSNEAIFLPSYRSYDLQIKAASNKIYRYDEQPKTITLYPGNFQLLEWKAEQINIVYTRIMNAPNKPLVDAHVKEDVSRNYNYTNEFGFIQLEVANGQKNVVFETERGDCTVTLPENIKFERNLATVDDLLCIPQEKKGHE